MPTVWELIQALSPLPDDAGHTAWEHLNAAEAGKGFGEVCMALAAPVVISSPSAFAVPVGPSAFAVADSPPSFAMSTAGELDVSSPSDLEITPPAPGVDLALPPDLEIDT